MLVQVWGRPLRIKDCAESTNTLLQVISLIRYGGDSISCQKQFQANGATDSLQNEFGMLVVTV